MPSAAPRRVPAIGPGGFELRAEICSAGIVPMRSGAEEIVKGCHSAREMARRALERLMARVCV